MAIRLEECRKLPVLVDLAALDHLRAQVGVLLPYGRKQESTADRIGLTYMARAGYDPAEAVGFWQRFAQYNQSRGGKSTPSFLSTHPLDDVRIKQIQEWLPEARQEYKQGVISAPAK
jgi:predicted Zn-dependent protease